MDFAESNALPIWISGVNLRWFCGYAGHELALIDDFRCDFCTFHFLLRLLDRYPVRVERKGGSCWFTPSHIFITAPHSPSVTFAHRSDEEDLRQLLRRITYIKDFDDPQRQIWELL